MGDAGRSWRWEIACCPPAASPSEGSVVPSLLLGAATGLLWAPCAGPVLGLVLTGAALSGPNAHTTLLLFVYAAGAATSLALAILAGGRVFAAMKKSLGAGEWIRRALGVAVLVGVATIVLGWDSSVLTRLSLSGTNRLEQSLISRFQPQTATTGPQCDHGHQCLHSQRDRGADGRQLPGRITRRGRTALAGGCDLVVELARAHSGHAARQGRAGRLLDLFLHQLPAFAAVRQGVVREVPGSRPGDHRRARARICLREGPR